MRGQTGCAPGICVAVISAAVLIAGLASAKEAAPAPPVKIGVVKSLFRDKPDGLVQFLLAPLRSLMETQTGLTPQIAVGSDAEGLGKQLMNKEAQLGVFHGFEFAWARQKYPQLKPLMISVSNQKELRSYLVVRQEAKVSSFADLKGRKLAYPTGSKEHSRLFLERHNEDGGQGPIAHVVSAAHGEDALDEVVDGNVDAAVVDRLALDCFKRRKKLRFEQLKVVQQSELFPAGVIAYLPGELDEATLERFRQGMLKARETERGRQLLTMCQIVGFEAVPKEYDQQLEAIGKAYPPPEASGR